MKNHIPPHTLAPPLAQPVYTSLLRWFIVSLFAVFITPTLYAQDPVVSDPTAINITSTTATLGGTLTDGVPSADISGVIYCITADFDDPLQNGASFDTAPEGAAGTGAFTVDVSSLQPGTQYSYRAFSSNGAPFYSDRAYFTTADAAPSIAPVPTSAAITFTAATLGGSLVYNGGDTVTERGIVFSTTNADPVVGTTVTDDPMIADTAGAFDVSVTGLTPGTTYFFQAYATNGIGTSLSSVGSFTTLALPTVTTTVGTPTVTTTTATPLEGDVTSQGGGALSARGVVYAVGAVTPTLDDQVAIEGATTTGAFSVGLTDLLTGTLYSYRAYATNGGGTSYGAVRTFTTVTAAPEVSLDAYVPSPTAVTLNATVDHAGGLAITARGFVFSATVSTGLTIGVANTTTVADTIGSGEGIAGPFSVDKTGLLPGTTYHYVAYARNTRGTTYTSVSTFTTSGTAPTVTLPTKVAITSTTATLGGTVAKTNGSAIQVRGVVYSSTDATPTIEEDAGFANATSLPGLGVFTAAVTGLSPATLYYFRAYAENDDGNGYSVVSSFTTLAAAPSVTTGTAGVPTSSSVAVPGNNVDANGAAITQRGIVVALSSVNAAPTLGATGTKGFVSSTNAEGLYSVAATGLAPFSQYSYRAYAINIRGTSYGAVKTVTTAAGAPTVNTPAATNLAARSVTLGGKIEKANGASITSYGVNVYQAGILIDTYSVNAAKLGGFTFSVTGLTPATTYSFEAFATNSKGTGTSSRVAFTTRKAVPTVVTSSAATTGLVRGVVADTNGAAVTRYGVIYSTSSTATLVLGGTNTLVTGVTGTTDGPFEVTATFKSGKTYYFKTFALNAIGYGYSAKESIVIPAAAPTVNARAATSIAGKSATLGGNIVDNGGKAIIERGVRYWKTATPASKTTKIIAGTALGIFSAPVYGLTPGTAYTFEAYAENSEGTTYSNDLTFTTTGTAPAILAGASAGASASETCYTTDAATGLKYLTIVISNAAQAPTVEVSGNLTDWFSGSSHTTVISDAGGILKVRDNTPVTAGAQRYIRVRP